MSEVPLYHGDINTPTMYAPPPICSSTAHAEKETFIASNADFAGYRGTSFKKTHSSGPYHSVCLGS